MTVDTLALNFEDSETQAILRSTAAEFLAARYPLARLYAIERGDEVLTRRDLQEVGGLGWMALTVPENDGGAGLSLLEAAVIFDELGYSGAPLPIAPANAVSGGLGRVGGFVALGEERRRLGVELRVDAGSLSGRVGLVASADLADMVLTRVAEGPREQLGLLPTARARLMPTPSVDTLAYFDLEVDAVPKGALNVVAQGEEAARIAERISELETAFRLLEAVGMMRRVVDLTTVFISNRIVFGQAVGTFQAARHRAANLFMDVEMARWVAYHSVWRLQRGPGDAAGLWLAKHWAIRAIERLLVHAHMLHGGVGVTMDYPLHLFTQGLVARATRGGDLEEMSGRALLEVPL